MWTIFLQSILCFSNSVGISGRTLNDYYTRGIYILVVVNTPQTRSVHDAETLHRMSMKVFYYLIWHLFFIYQSMDYQHTFPPSRRKSWLCHKELTAAAAALFLAQSTLSSAVGGEGCLFLHYVYVFFLLTVPVFICKNSSIVFYNNVLIP